MTECKESPLVTYLHGKASAKRIPLSSTAELSPLCNFRCPMCYVRMTRGEIAASGKRLLTAAEWLKISEEAAGAGTLFMLITGGEPFARSDFFEIYEGMRSLGFVMSINTNGSLIDSERAGRLARCMPARVNVSMYGASAETYGRMCGDSSGYSKTLRGIRCLISEGINVKISVSVTPDNREDFPGILGFCRENGLPLEYAVYMFPPTRRRRTGFRRASPADAAESMYECAIKQFPENDPTPVKSLITDRKSRCRAGRSSYWITWSGEMTPCGMTPKPSVSVTEQGFDKAWRKITEVIDKIELSEECASCDKRGICHECLASAFAETGCFEGTPKYLCSMAEEYLSIVENKRCCIESLSEKGENHA